MQDSFRYSRQSDDCGLKLTFFKGDVFPLDSKPGKKAASFFNPESCPLPGCQVAPGGYGSPPPLPPQSWTLRKKIKLILEPAPIELISDPSARPQCVLDAKVSKGILCLIIFYFSVIFFSSGFLKATQQRA